MKVIKQLVDDIKEELKGAENYATLAKLNREGDKVLADTYHKLSEVEMSHVTMLHTQIARIISEYEKSGEEPRPDMKAIWEWQHKELIEQAANVKSLIALYSAA